MKMLTIDGMENKQQEKKQINRTLWKMKTTIQSQNENGKVNVIR